MYFIRKILFNLYFLSAISLASEAIYAQTCINLFSVDITHATVVQQSLRWEKDLLGYFASPNPNFKKIKDSVRALESIDTSSPIIQKKLSNIVSLINVWAKSIVSAPSQRFTQISELEDISKKLKLLNTPALRNLILGDDLRSRIGQVAWIFNRTLRNKNFTLEEKIDQITNLLNQISTPNSPISSERAIINTSISVKIAAGDVMKSESDAVITNIGCSGLCGSNIHGLLNSSVKNKVSLRNFKDGETFVLRDGKVEDNDAKNFVFIADGLGLPLSRLVTSALTKAESSGFQSVAMPAFRSGYAFGAVEMTHAQVINEILNGIANFQRISQGTLKEITILVFNNEALHDQFKAELNLRTKKQRERSLREDIRDAPLSGGGFTLFPSKVRPAIDTRSSPIYSSLLKPWSLVHLLDVHKPVNIGAIKDKNSFSSPTVSVLNMPIKMPGSDFRIPVELAQFREFLQKIIDHEVEINPELDSFYAYLTVDQSPVKGGNTHRRGGIHIDGVQGARYPIKLPPEHTYSVSDNLGTIFYEQPFDLRNLDPNRQHVHAELERQAKLENRIVTEDYKLYFWDSYSVHEAAKAEADMTRTFVRLEFSKKIYDGTGDTESPLFEYSWSRIPRPIPESLDDKPL